MKQLNAKAMSEAIEKIVSSLGYDVLKAVNVNQFQSAVNDFMPGTMFEVEKQTLSQCIRIGVGDEFIQAIGKTGEEQKRTVANIQKSLLEDYAIHKDRVDCIINAFAKAVKDYISTEQYLQCLDESIRAWVDLRTDKSAEEFLQDLVDNSDEVEKYFSDEDKRYFITLCDAYYEAKQKNELGNICLKLSAYVNGKAAIKYYKEAAKQGNTKAQYCLGVCYYTSGDYDQAVKLCRKAAEQGHADAQFMLGNCYYYVDRDYTEAVKWYRKAAEHGYAIAAQFVLGNCYKNGNGVLKDDAEAVKWYRKAAERGHAVAQFMLGECYYNGEGVSKNYTEAVKWYRKAAEEEIKFFSFYKAAEQGYAEAQFHLGFSYYYGLDTNEDKVEAVKWYRKAAEQGHAVAQLMLGECYENGNGVDRDYTEAEKWYSKAAEQGYDRYEW